MQADLAAGLTLAALIAYAVLAGADFGGGIWDAFARGPRRDAQRDAIAHAMGPVWEANHVWLIFVVVLLFTCFPSAYAALGEGLFVPFHLVLLGIILRGAAFVFRAYSPRSVRRPGRPGRGARRWGAVFGAASVITPVLLGMCLGAVSAGGRQPTRSATNSLWLCITRRMARMLSCLASTARRRESAMGDTQAVSESEAPRRSAAARRSLAGRFMGSPGCGMKKSENGTERKNE